ncbi:MAG: TetR/AcrR family transcriptional regulator [Chloracidobacterium sp.]|uniref:TetR/AcrR family transcriptional regulator n=1 Tax=Chloracidobacterium validum TaxID=2821543 RepID=A0ABX8BCX9_9BACT|nr:TetR/AcrR family transcriptional regulator [Chloracidobacterium validum]QUW03509.1 TetR/AcrR family transcriptional regulator [Chloracidobacterium validum]
MARLAATTRTADKLPTSTSKGENGKHDTILRAAIKVFARNGYFNSKVSDVAREAGVADGTVYLYFKNKDDLLFSIITEMLDSFIAHVRAAIAPLTSPLAQLREIARLHLEMLGRDRDLAVVFEVEIRHSTKFMEEFSTKKLSEYLDLIQQVIEDGQRVGEFRAEINARIATKVFFGALDEMATNWILSRRGKPLAGAVEPVLDLLLHGLAPQARHSAPQLNEA